MLPEASLSGSVIDIVIKTENLRTVPVECHGDDTSITFHDTTFSYLLILLVHVSKFNVHDTPTEIDLTPLLFLVDPTEKLSILAFYIIDTTN